MVSNVLHLIHTLCQIATILHSHMYSEGQRSLRYCEVMFACHAIRHCIGPCLYKPSSAWVTCTSPCAPLLYPEQFVCTVSQRHSDPRWLLLMRPIWHQDLQALCAGWQLPVIWCSWVSVTPLLLLRECAKVALVHCKHNSRSTLFTSSRCILYTCGMERIISLHAVHCARRGCVVITVRLRCLLFTICLQLLPESALSLDFELCHLGVQH